MDETCKESLADTWLSRHYIQPAQVKRAPQSPVPAHRSNHLAWSTSSRSIIPPPDPEALPTLPPSLPICMHACSCSRCCCGIEIMSLCARKARARGLGASPFCVAWFVAAGISLPSGKQVLLPALPSHEGASACAGAGADARSPHDSAACLPLRAPGVSIGDHTRCAPFRAALRMPSTRRHATPESGSRARLLTDKLS